MSSTVFSILWGTSVLKCEITTRSPLPLCPWKIVVYISSQWEREKLIKRDRFQFEISPHRPFPNGTKINWCIFVRTKPSDFASVPGRNQCFAKRAVKIEDFGKKMHSKAGISPICSDVSSEFFQRKYCLPLFGKSLTKKTESCLDLHCHPLS